MPATVHHAAAFRSHWMLPALLGLACLVSLPARAQQAAGASAQDPALVIARTVQPRIAYRGVPLEDNPVHSSATTFPARIFHGTLDRTITQLVDGDLGQRGSAGVAAAASAMPALSSATTSLGGSALLGPSASGGTSIGPAATVGGAVGGATAGLGGLITGNVMQTLDATRSGGGP